MEIDWCTRHTEWEEGCKYCGPKPEFYAEVLQKFKESDLQLPTNIMYKIQNKKGLYADGNCFPNFKKEGYVFWSLSELTKHFEEMDRYTDPLTEYKNCVIVEFAIKEKRTEKFEFLYKHLSDKE